MRAKTITITRMLLVGLLGVAISACASNRQPNLTPLQIQELQTRSFDDASKSQLFAATLTALQNEGYTISNSDRDSGVISAEGEAKTEVKFSTLGFLAGMAGAMLGGGGSGPVKVTASGDPANEIRYRYVVTATISASNPGSKLRLNMVRKILAGSGKDFQELRSKYYTKLFNGVADSLFVEQ